MTKSKWKAAIEQACKQAGTYRPEFEHVIDSLAGIMETRDKAQTAYKKTGSKPIVEHTNKGGATNTVKNPALVVVMDLNTQALAYWRDLGLTPAGLKRLNEGALKPAEKKGSALEEALKGLGG